jgi:beta-lactamase regulating signal transducer with metallopeptidase domain
MIALLSAIVLKASILMTAAAFVIVLMSRASAAGRHFAWTFTVAGLLLLPIFAAGLPTWKVALPIALSDINAPIDRPGSGGTWLTGRPSVTASDTTASGFIDGSPSGSVLATVPWEASPAVIYVLGVLFLLARILFQRSAARRIAKDATLVTDREWKSLLDDCAARIGVVRAVTLRRSREQLVPVTMGTRAPSVVIPADADTWDEDRRRAVLLHELAHIARHDCLTQILSATACALYWFHPGVWYVARRLRIERELACDDRVLAAGAHAPDYAGHLLELAYTWSGRRAAALAVGMTSSRKLEGRMRAILDPARNRTAPTRRMWLAGAVLGAALLVPLAAVTMTTVSADVRSRRMASSSEHDLHDRAQDSRAQMQERSGGAQQNSVTGTWELRPSSRGRVSLRVEAGEFSVSGDFDESEIEGLTSQTLSNTTGPIRFSIPREAGTIEIEGTLRAGRGSGSFRFVPSQTFVAGLTRRGFASPTASQLFSLAQNDIGFELIDELATQKYARPEIDDLVRAAHHGVREDFVREMGEVGYRVGTLDALIRFRDHGVDPEFVRELREQGVSDLSPQDLVRFRDHGVDPDYVADLRGLGYTPVPFEMLLRSRDHGVDGEYLRGMRQLGFTLTLDEAIRTRDHGVDPEFAGSMQGAGYTLATEELIRARDHGVTPDYIAAMAVLGYKGVGLGSLIRMRDHGVTPDYVLEMQKRGLKNLSVDEVIRLRDRGERNVGQEIRDALARLADQYSRLADRYYRLVRDASHERAAAGNVR